MKTFKDICKMTQAEVKEYMDSYLSSKGYKTINEDGFLYAKGTEPVLLVAHMDTVHKEQCKEIIDIKGNLSSPQGIGGDDRCGVFIIMNLVKELNCSVLLCEDEEKGGIGAHKFAKTEYIKNLDVNYMIEFDRKNSNDAVFYHCGNEEFIDFVTDVTGYKFTYGSYSDISTLMPAAKLCAVNLSCGYYNAHTSLEYVKYDEMMDTIEAAKCLIKEKCDEPFKYTTKKVTPIAKNFSTMSHASRGFDSYYNDLSYYNNFLDTPPAHLYEDQGLADIARNDKDLELEVTFYGPSYSEEVIQAYGETKAECWMNLFFDNPNLRFNDIVDYTWG